MFNNDNLKKFIEKAIDDYIIEEGDPNSVDDIAEALDIGNLSEKIANELNKRVLRFEINMALDPCSKCYRPYGAWLGAAHQLNDELVRKNGVSIIVADDF